MAPKTPQKMTITDVAPSIEDKNNQKIVDKTPSIDDDDEETNSQVEMKNPHCKKNQNTCLPKAKVQASLLTSPWTTKCSPTLTSFKSRSRFRPNQRNIIVAVNVKVHNKSLQSDLTKAEYKQHRRDLDNQEKFP
eukprot:8353465-Ditylum_brightwellii.AAC.1